MGCGDQVCIYKITSVECKTHAGTTYLTPTICQAARRNQEMLGWLYALLISRVHRSDESHFQS